MSEESDLAVRLASLEEELGELYRERRPILARLAELRGPAVLPDPIKRTETQKAVARCPRCGGDIS